MSCENCEESAYVIDKLAKLLAEIAVIVNGPEPPLTSWSYHDLPEKVRALKDAQQPAAAVPDVDAEAKAWTAWTAEHTGNKWTAAEAFEFRRAFIDGYRAAMLAAALAGKDGES